MNKDNENKVDIDVSVTPRIFMRGYYTPGVHESPNWYCFLRYSFWANIQDNSKKENNDFDITVPDEPYLFELTLSYGSDFEKVRKEGIEKAKNILGNMSISINVNDLTFNDRIKKEIAK